MRQILDHLWIGSPADLDRLDLKAKGVNALFNVAADLPPPPKLFGWPEFAYAHYGLIDGWHEPNGSLTVAAAVLDSLLQQGRTVLVYCHGEVSRSPAVVISYLQGTDPQGWHYWLEYVRRKQPAVNPHAAFEHAFRQEREEPVVQYADKQEELKAQLAACPDWIPIGVSVKVNIAMHNGELYTVEL